MVERGHEIPQETREQLAMWFRTWLLGDKNPVHEGPRVSIPMEALQCTESGQVLTSVPGAVSMPAYNVALSKSYAAQRDEFVEKDKEIVAAKVKELLGLAIPDEKVRAEETGSAELRNYDMKKYQLVRVGQMVVPCVVLVPENVTSDSPVVLYLNEGGKHEVITDDQIVGSYINNNEIMVIPDFRGIGETQDPLSMNDTKFWNKEYRNAMISMHIGNPIMGQRVVDMMTVLDFIEADDLLKNREINVVGNGVYGPVVVHAAYLDNRIGQS